MKTIEEKAKAYDKALIEAVAAYKDEDRHQKATLERIFPELKESKGEKIRKAILEFFELQEDNTTYSFITKKDILAWLESQEEKHIPEDVNEAALQYVDTCLADGEVTHDNVIEPYWNNHSMTKAYKAGWLKSQHEQKTIDRAERKFKVEKDKWYICTKSFALRGDIVVIKGQIYQSNQNGAIEGEDKHLFIDTHDGKASDYFRFWTIQDAKDGDVLCAKGSYFREFIFMFSSLTEDNVISTHFGYDVFHRNFYKKLARFGREGELVSITPATKEQRDLLFEKIHEAKYEWDADKKELKNSERKFKVGEWGIDNLDGTVFQITKELRNTYAYKTVDGGAYCCTHTSLEIDARHWTLTDAKDGDVLVCNGEKYGQAIGIVKRYVGKCGSCNQCFETYCFIDWDGIFRTGEDMGSNEIYPATREQRDTLIKAMTDAGYTFDFEKKELKKLESDEPDALIEESYQQQADDIIDIVSEKSTKSKEAGKVESKFHKGEWIIDKQGIVHQIANVIENVTNHTYGYDIVGGGYFNDTTEGVRLWTIKDAKDGDVLASHECLVIFKCIDDLNIKCYCTYHHIGFNPSFRINTLHNKACFYPATKEQLDTIERAISYAGYKWNPEKKELQKVEQKPTNKVNPLFSIGDVMRTLKEASNGIKNGLPVVVSIDDEYYHCTNELISIKDQDNYEYPPMNRNQNTTLSEEDEAGFADTLWAIQQARTIAKDENDMGNLWYAEKWLKSIKDKVQLQPKQVWNEKDEGMFNSIITDIQLTLEARTHEVDQAVYEREIDWLKSLKDRYTWKPSDEQMVTLEHYIHTLVCNNYKEMLFSLYQDLKKLKE